MSLLMLFIGFCCVAVTGLAQCAFLAPTRLGALFYYPNILIDTAWKRLGLQRERIELFSAILGLAVLLLSAELTVAAAFALALALAALKLQVRRAEYVMLTAVHAQADSRRPSCPTDQLQPTVCGCIPDPAMHPDLIVNLSGPFVARLPAYQLGDLALGRRIEIVVIIANHSLIPGSVPVSLSVSLGRALEGMALEKQLPPLSPGSFHSVDFRLQAATVSGPGTICIRIGHGEQIRDIEIRYASVFDAAAARITGAAVSRYPGGASAAFAWRGDMDHYDTVTFQSMEGLAHTLGLAARYRFPQTMYLSTRLSLDAAETERFYDHFGVSRGQEHIERFKAWMREQVELRHEIRYPFSFEKPYAIELGNHMHLHYGTDAAAALENQWRLMAGIGAGAYPWMSGEAGSFAEQRDNALAARQAMEQAFAFTPKSWAMPDSTNDRHTPAAVEAAGCEVTSDADASHRDNVLVQPPPHHPAGTSVVELTKRYPGDPQSYVHYAMILFWLHRAHRRRLPVVFMAHQHLRMYEGHACTRFTEAVMRHVLTRFNGDLHINTVYGIGKYWREVLSPATKTVAVTRREGAVEVRNTGDYDVLGLPLDLQLEGGRAATVLIDLPAGAAVAVAADGTVVTL